MTTVSESILAFAVKAEIANPLDGVLPDFSFGGTEFTQLWQKVIAAVWAIGILAAIIFLIIGIVSMAGASGDSNPNPQAHAQGRRKAIWAGISLAVLAGLAIVVGAVLSFAG
jgi:heme/copper-type cytochrome/quinol oxidase subunit 2